jgi:hypothetical protein
MPRLLTAAGAWGTVPPEVESRHRGHGMRVAITAFALALVALLTPTLAHASATMTYPAPGQTVTLDKNASFSFSWTLPADESNPTVYVGDTPTVDPEFFAGFSPVCGQDGVSSCEPETPPNAGTHYAFITTSDPNSPDGDISPVTKFIVPPVLGWGCGPQSSCHQPPTQGTLDSLFGGFSDFSIAAWINAPGVTVTISYTLRHGRAVIKRIHQVVQAGWDWTVQAGFEVYQAGPQPTPHAIRLRGLHGAKRLTVTTVVQADGLSITRTATMPAPLG